MRRSAGLPQAKEQTCRHRVVGDEPAAYAAQVLNPAPVRR
jgi:hypothetical protein